MYESIGITGTREGPTITQQAWLIDRLVELKKDGAIYLHHGDCVGVDEIAHCIAEELNYRIAVHPPLSNSHRAWCRGYIKWQSSPYLNRNRDIVNCSELLLALPKGPPEFKGSGTWMTVRYAQSKKTPVEVCMPNGTIEVL